LQVKKKNKISLILTKNKLLANNFLDWLSACGTGIPAYLPVGRNENELMGAVVGCYLGIVKC